MCRGNRHMDLRAATRDLRVATRDLRDAINTGKVTGSLFQPDQLKAIQAGIPAFQIGPATIIRIPTAFN